MNHGESPMVTRGVYLNFADNWTNCALTLKSLGIPPPISPPAVTRSSVELATISSQESQQSESAKYLVDIVLAILKPMLIIAQGNGRDNFHCVLSRTGIYTVAQIFSILNTERVEQPGRILVHVSYALRQSKNWCMEASCSWGCNSTCWCLLKSSMFVPYWASGMESGFVCFRAAIPVARREGSWDGIPLS